LLYFSIVFRQRNKNCRPMIMFYYFCLLCYISQIWRVLQLALELDLNEMKFITKIWFIYIIYTDYFIFWWWFLWLPLGSRLTKWKLSLICMFHYFLFFNYQFFFYFLFAGRLLFNLRVSVYRVYLRVRISCRELSAHIQQLSLDVSWSRYICVRSRCWIARVCSFGYAVKGTLRKRSSVRYRFGAPLARCVVPGCFVGGSSHGYGWVYP